MFIGRIISRPLCINYAAQSGLGSVFTSCERAEQVRSRDTTTKIIMGICMINKLDMDIVVLCLPGSQRVLDPSDSHFRAQRHMLCTSALLKLI